MMTRLKQWFAAAVVAGAGVWSAQAAMTHAVATLDTRAMVLAEILPESCTYETTSGDYTVLTVTFAEDVSGEQFELPENLGPIAFDLNGRTLVGAAGTEGDASVPGGDGAWVFKVGGSTTITVLDSAGDGRIVGGKGGDGYPAGAGAYAFVDASGAQFAVTDEQGLVQKGADGVTLCTVTLDAQGGEGGTASVIATWGETMPSPVVKPTKAGYTFQGYFDQTAGGVQWYDARGVSTNVSTFASAATLYAQWQANTYKYVLDAGAFSNELAVTYGQVPKDLSRVPVAENKSFLGYFDEMDHMIYNAKGEYVGGAEYAVAGDTVLTAMWSENPETVEIVAAKQRWPWNGKMDIAYVADSLHAERSYVLDVELTVTEPGASEPVTRSVLVSIPSENGEHTVMADFGGVVAAETLDAGASVVLRLMLDKK